MASSERLPGGRRLAELEPDAASWPGRRPRPAASGSPRCSCARTGTAGPGRCAGRAPGCRTTLSGPSVASRRRPASRRPKSSRPDSVADRSSTRATPPPAPTCRARRGRRRTSRRRPAAGRVEAGGPGQPEVAVERRRSNAGTHSLPPITPMSEQAKSTVRIGTAFHGGHCHSKRRPGADGTRSRQSGQPEPPTHTTPQPNARSARSSAYPNEGDPSMAKGIRFYETGGPEVLRWESLPVGEPGPGEVRVRHVAVGLNFADTYFRTGLYPARPARRHGRRGGRRHRGRRPRGHRLRRGRPGHLHRQPARRLQHRARHGRRPADQAARRDPVRDRRRDDHARPHLRLPAAPDRTPRRPATPSCCTRRPVASVSSSPSGPGCSAST